MSADVQAVSPVVPLAPRRRAVTVEKLDRAARVRCLSWLAARAVSGETADWPPEAVPSLLAAFTGDRPPFESPGVLAALWDQAVDAERLAEAVRWHQVSWQQVDHCTSHEQAAEETSAAAFDALMAVAGSAP